MDGYCMTVKNPEPESKLWAVAGPYGLLIWSLIVLSLIMAALCFWLISGKGFIQAALGTLGMSLNQDPAFGNSHRYKSKASCCMMLRFSKLISISTRLHGSSLFRTFFLTFSLSFFVLTQAYSGSLVSHLTVDVLPPRMKTWAEVMAKDIAYQTYGLFFKHDLLSSPDPAMRHMASSVVLVEDGDRPHEAVLTGAAGLVDSNVALTAQIRQFMVDE